MAAPRVTIDQLPDNVALTGDEYLVMHQATQTVKTSLSEVTGIPAANLDAHVNGVTDVHDATAISVPPNAGTMTGSDVASQLGQAANAIASNTTAIASSATAINENAATLSGHIGAAADAHDASAISLVPVAGLTATEVQAAIAELKALIDALTP
jgi:hypothetical protein